MTGRRACKTCGRPVHNPGPAYCSAPCWDKSVDRRRRDAAARSRARRDAINAAANQLFTEQIEPIR